MNITKIKITTLLIAIFILGIVLFGFMVSYFVIKDVTTLELSEIPDGRLLKTSDSFDKRYSLEVSEVSLNALSQFGYKGEIIDNLSEESRVIYFEYPSSHPTVEIIWKDSYVVSINGIVLDIRCDTYDSRKN